MTSQENIPTKKTTVAERFNFDEPTHKLADQIRERHPDWPAIRMDFHFNMHYSEHDMEGFESLVDRNDVLFYEAVGESASLSKFLNEVSHDPSRTLESYLDRPGGDIRAIGTYYKPIIEAIYKSDIAVGSIDIGNDDIGNDLVEKFVEIGRERVPKDASLDEAIELYSGKLAKEAMVQNDRELLMAGNLEKELEKIFNDRPELKEKSDISVLVSMGAYHTRLRRIFAENGIKSDRYFTDGNTHVYGYRDQVIRSYAFNQEVSDDVKKRAYIESMLLLPLAQAMRHDAVASDEETLYLRNALSRLTEEDLQEIFELDTKSWLSIKKVDEIFTGRGIGPLPRTRIEIEQSNDKHYKWRKRKVGKQALVA